MKTLKFKNIWSREKQNWYEPYAWISMKIGYHIFYFTAIFFITHAMYSSFEIFVTVALSSVGFLGVFSAICYTAIPVYTSIENQTLREYFEYAGEKFLHSALLMTQGLVLRYAVNDLPKIEWLNAIDPVSTITIVILSYISLPVVAFGIYFAMHGFEALNNIFWVRYIERKKIYDLKHRKLKEKKYSEKE